MNRITTIHAINEALRFIRAAEAVINRDDGALAEQRKAEEEGRRSFVYRPFYGSKETGAMRRASLDLTRALAEMRRGS